MKLFQSKNHNCRDWMYNKGCKNKQWKEAKNGLCTECEINRKREIKKQIEDLLTGE